MDQLMGRWFRTVVVVACAAALVGAGLIVVTSPRLLGVHEPAPSAPGRRTFDLAGHWNGDHHDGVPIVVLTRSAPAEPAPGHARYVTDVREAAAQAKEAAGDRNVLLHGAEAARACLRAGVLD